MSWPSALRRSSAIERLLRLCTCHHTEVPSFTRRQLRSGSPAPGASILMTSAPKSPSVLPAKGPAISCPISMTLSPARASACMVCMSLRVSCGELQSMVAPLSLTMRAQRGRSSRTSVANCSVLLK